MIVQLKLKADVEVVRFIASMLFFGRKEGSERWKSWTMCERRGAKRAPETREVTSEGERKGRELGAKGEERDSKSWSQEYRLGEISIILFEEENRRKKTQYY
jgi:hypothetical protein